MGRQQARARLLRQGPRLRLRHLAPVEDHTCRREHLSIMSCISSYCLNILLSPRITGDDREKQMNEDLGDVSRLLGNIKNQALDTNSELNRQNQQLDVIQDKVIDILMINK